MPNAPNASNTVESMAPVEVVPKAVEILEADTRFDNPDPDMGVHVDSKTSVNRTEFEDLRNKLNQLKERVELINSRSPYRIP